MYETILSNVKSGGYFHRVPTETSPIHVLDFFDCFSKKYCFHRYNDQKESLCKGTMLVYVTDLDELKKKHLASDTLTGKLV